MEDLSARLAAALGRIDAFSSVQRGAERDELMAAVLCLQEAVGIDAETRAVLCEGIERLRFQSQSAGVLLGLVVGLFAAEG